MGMVLVFNHMCIYPYLAYTCTLNCLYKVSVSISNKNKIELMIVKIALLLVATNDGLTCKHILWVLD